MPSRSSPGLPPSPQKLEQFNKEIHLLLKANNPQARSLLAFIRRTLLQFHLQGRFSEIDIFIIAYLRGVDQLLKPLGQPIQKPKAWMRITTLNVIREQSRLQAKECPLTAEPADVSEKRMRLHETVFEDNYRIVVQAFNRLSTDDRKIVELKYLQGRPWKDVLEKLGEPSLSLSTLRKRGQRALESLRKEYHIIKPPIDRPD